MNNSLRAGMGWAAAAAILLYLNALPGILFWDSEVLILNNVFLRSFAHLPDIWTTSVMAGGGTATNYYRPLPVTLFLLMYQLWGAAPLGYHAFAILCHAAAAALVFAWARRLTGDAVSALWTALVFALHPVHNETVNYIDHVEGILAMLGGFAALLLYISGRRRWSLLPLAASLLSKEEGVVFFLFIALYEYYRPFEARPVRWAERWTHAKRLLPHVALGLVYVGLKLTVFNFLNLPLSGYGAQAGTFGGLGLRLLTFARALADYARLLILPTGLHFDRDLAPVTSYAAPAAWACALGAAALAWLLWRSLRASRPARYALLCSAAALLPYSGLIPFNNLIAEHFLYIPSVGLILAAVVFIRAHRARIPSGLLRAAVGAVLLFFCVQGLRRNRDWQDPVRLYKTTLKGNPRSYRAANNLGAEYFRRGERNAARKAFDMSLAARPTYAPALNNIGAIVEAEGRLAQALDWYGRSAQNDPGYALAHKNRAGVLYNLKRYEEAAAAARRAVELYPQYGKAWNLLGAASFALGRRADAAAAFERAVAAEPSRGVYYNLANAYEALGRRAEALKARQLGARYDR